MRGYVRAFVCGVLAFGLALAMTAGKAAAKESYAIAMHGAPGAGCWAWAPGASKVAVSAVAANRAKTRPRGRTDAAKIRKFIAENPF